MTFVKDQETLGGCERPRCVLESPSGLEAIADLRWHDRRVLWRALAKMSWKDSKDLSRVERISGTCVHFTGIGDDGATCEAGIAYLSVRDDTTRPYAWPCMLWTQPTTTCALAKYPTEEEAEREVREVDAELARQDALMESGRCPECEEVVSATRKEGNCLYAEPCGHRLGQAP